MRNIVLSFLLMMLFFQVTTAAAGTIDASTTTPDSVNNSPSTQPAKTSALAKLERMLLGRWGGGPCVGDFTFNADGTYKLRNFTPGTNTLTGTWSVRWDALPPTLILTCKTSDFKTLDPSRNEYEYLGKPLEVKLIELQGDTLVLKYLADKPVGILNDYTETYVRPAQK